MTLIEAAKRVQAAWRDPQGMPEMCKAMDALDQAIAKAEQEEPVAWLTGCPECGMAGGCNCGNSTWQGLTDKELDDLWLAHHDYLGQPKTSAQNGWAFERAIEAKLKEKTT